MTTKEDAMVPAFMPKIKSAKHMRHWISMYLGLDLPDSHIDPDSNSSPIEWLWEAYSAYRDNRGSEIPGFIVLSSRESYKTLSESILAVILMVHFGCTIAHLAAIESQASKAVSYINGFINKIKPYLEANGLLVNSQNKRTTEVSQKDGTIAYVQIIIATVTGCNSAHTNIMTIDEIDVMRFPKAYEEAQLIPAYIGKQYPLTIKTSTRKYAFGLMEQEIQKSKDTGEVLLRWNLLDITERCPPSRHLPDQPKQTRYIRKKELPLTNMSEGEYLSLMEDARTKFTPIEAYAGCATCPLLSVCEMRLAHRSQDDLGGLFKPITFTIGQFRKTSPDMGEAQLLCWRPSTKGLVYPKMDYGIDTNSYSIDRAWEIFTGNTRKNVTFQELITQIQYKGVPVYGHVDWGFRHNFAIVISATMPNGEWWILHTIAVPGLELDSMVKIALECKATFGVRKWHPDTAQPSFIKTFNGKGLSCTSFKKDVDAGIEAVRTQIVDASDRRRLKVILTEANEFLIDGFKNHHFKLDAAGNPTREPDDEQYADVCVTPDTLIMTENGAKPIVDIKINEKVLTHTGRFQRVSKIMSRPYSGSLVQINSSCKPALKLTPNHPVYVSEMYRSYSTESGVDLTGQRRCRDDWGFIPSGDIEMPQKRKTQPIPAVMFPEIIDRSVSVIDFKEFVPWWIEKDGVLYGDKKIGALSGQEKSEIDRFVTITPELAFLIGYYVAEGSVGNHIGQVNLAGHVRETNVMDIIESATAPLNVNGVTFRESKTTNGRSIYFSSTPLAHFLYSLNKSIYKQFPQWVMRLSDENTYALLAGYLFGDGCFCSASTNNAASTSNSISSKVASVVYALLVKLGYKPALRKSLRKGKYVGLSRSGMIEHDSYIVALNAPDTNDFLDKIFTNPLIKKAFADKKIDRQESQQSSFRQIRTSHGLVSSIQSVESVPYDGYVYNLEVDGDNSYIANFTAVHNCDALRYGAQNLFKAGTKIRVYDPLPNQFDRPSGGIDAQKVYSDWMKEKIHQLTGGYSSESKIRSSDGSVFVDFSDPSDIIIDDE
jgi:intein/homing endonuclease